MKRRALLVLTAAATVAPGLHCSAVMADTRLVGDLPHRGAQALLALPGIDAEYGVINGPGGARLRSIVTRPAGRTGRLPAVLFVGWLSCDSVDFSVGMSDGWSLMQKQLITQSNALWMRIDKSGVGDSLGTPCAQLDYETELGQYRAALDALYRRPDVDPARIVVFGASMGATYAPLVAAGHQVAGVVVWGGGATTWFERMLAFERHALELGGTDPARLSDEMKARERFFARYLLQGESPEAITHTDPALGEVWKRVVGASGELHYGRPLAFHQQAQRQDWPAAWARIDAPVLALYGEYDWFESADAVRLIADTVNRVHPGKADFHELAGINHHFTRYPSRTAAYREQGGSADPGEFVRTVLAWLDSVHVRTSP